MSLLGCPVPMNCFHALMKQLLDELKNITTAVIVPEMAFTENCVLSDGTMYGGECLKLAQ